MARIEIYPSGLPGDPLETHQVNGGTFTDWLKVNCPSFVEGQQQPISVSVGGMLVPPAQWCNLLMTGDAIIQVRPNPRDPGSLVFWVIGAVLATVVVMTLLRPNIPRRPGLGTQGEQLSGADIKANTPRPNGVIPEIAGQFRVFPDYLCQPRRYFTTPTQQAIDVMLCIGTGEYTIPDAQIRIGETPLQDLSELANYTIFAPGQNVTGHPAHRNWYNAPEVGSSAGSSGLRLVSGSAGTPQASATQYRIDGDSISIPAGAGVAPQDWEIGNVVSIVARTRSIVVVDGGGTFFSPNRDFVRGSFGDLALSPSNELFIIGAGLNDGRYRVNTISTSVSEAGTPSTIVGVRVAELNFLAVPATFNIKGFDVTLDDDYIDHDALVDEINAQIGGAVASHSGGVVTITESSPYSGFFIALSGWFDLVFGASPNFTVGVKTDSYDELTLDVWVSTTDEEGNTTEGWEPATRMSAGTFNAVEVQRPRIKTVTTQGIFGPVTTTQYFNTEYRITALITGAIPGGTGVIGWEFQRLNPDGTDDGGWSGFAVETTTPLVTITIASDQVVGGWIGPFKATPPSESSGLIEFDIFCPSGLGSINRESGAVSGRTRFFELQWRSGSGSWTPIQYSVAGASRDQLGFTYQITLPSALPNLEVRIRRIGAEDTSLESLDRIEWYGLKTLLAAPASYAGVTTMALSLEGSDRISNKSENQINMLVTRRLNGVNTRSIAEWVRYVCGTVGYEADDINEAELAPLETLWNSRGDWFDMAFIGQTTVKEVLQSAFRTGFADLTIDAGKIRPARDQARTTFEHVYTPQNMTAALRRQFTAYDPDDYDGVDVEYTDANTWEQETVECRLPGDAGTRVEKIRIDGVTSRTRAWRIGMRQRRIQVYRRKVFKFSTEWDALNSRYLSYCALTDDVPGYGQSALLAGMSGNVVTVSEPLRWEEDASHVVAFRRPDGTLCGPFPASRIDDYTISMTGALDFAPIIGASAIETTHVIFGKTSTWSYPVLVTEIVPSGDDVDVTAVIYDDRVYLDDDNAPV